MSAGRTITLRLTIADPVPGVAYSLHDKTSHPVGPKVAGEGPLSFDVPLRLADGRRFLGEFVRSEGPQRRFIYIAVGTSAGDAASPWSRRMKVDIHTIPEPLLSQALDGAVLEADLAGRDGKGGPACATTPARSWRAL